MAAGLFALAGLLAAPASFLALRDARAAQRALENVVDSARQGEAEAAQRDLEAARDHLRSAESRLSSIWTQPARLVPLAGRQFRTADAITSAARGLATFGSAAVDALRAQPGGSFTVRQGDIDIDALRTAGEALSGAMPVAGHAVETVEGAPRTWLLPPLRSARQEAEEAVGRAASLLRKGAAGLLAAPGLLGEDGLRRYAVLNSNLSELRGTGGILSYYALVEAEQGSVRVLPEPGRTAGLPRPADVGVRVPDWYMRAWGQFIPQRTWQNVNMTTDFPTAAEIMRQMVVAAHGPIDGVVQIDPHGLAALLDLTGPIAVEGWPEAVGSHNIARIAQHDMYIRYDAPAARDGFAERLVGEVFGQVLRTDLSLGLSDLEGLGEAVLDGHIKMYAADSRLQQSLAAAGIDGRPRDEGATDLFGAFVLNAQEGKADWFLERSVDYRARIDATGTLAEVTARVELTNNMPAEGLPRYILGSPEIVGANDSIVAFLRPEDSVLLRLSIDGQEVPSVQHPEAERFRIYRTRVVIPSMTTSVVEATFAQPLLRPVTGTYDLKLIRQTSVAPDLYTVTVDESSSVELELTRDTVVSVRPVSPRLWDRMLLDPLRTLGRWVNPFS